MINLVQHRASTHLGGVEKDWFLYDFTGNVTSHKITHKPSTGSALSEVITQTYDTWDRPARTTLGILKLPRPHGLGTRGPASKAYLSVPSATNRSIDDISASEHPLRGFFVLGNTVSGFFKEQKNVRTRTLKYMKTCNQAQKSTRKQCFTYIFNGENSVSRS